MGGTNHRRQLARTCKKFGLLVQPNALPALIRELEARDGGVESVEFLELLGMFQNRLARAPSPKLVSLQLVQQVLFEQEQQAEQQQQQQKAKKKRNKMVLRDEYEYETTEENQIKIEQQQQHHREVPRPRSRSKSSTTSGNRNRPIGSSSISMSMPTPKPWKIVSAFETPKLAYDSMRRQFRYESSSSSLMGTANDLMDMRTQRYELVKQKVDRYREQHRLSCVTTIDRLLGTATNANANAKTSQHQQTARTLLGMLRSNPALGCLELEDPTGSIPLLIDLPRTSTGSDDGTNTNTNNRTTTDVDTRGIYLEGSMVLVRGHHEESQSRSHANTEDSSGTVFRCTSIELPPLESKKDTVLGLPPSPHYQNGGVSLQGQAPVPIYALSNLSLDQEECLERVGNVIDRMVYETSGGDDDDDDSNNNTNNSNSNKVGAILVLFGNFCTETVSASGALEELANLLREKQIPSRHSVLLVPGPNDVGSNACWPLPAWNKRNTPSSLHPFLATETGEAETETIHRATNNSKNNSNDGNVHLCSNPCRLEFSDGRQVVLLRKDLIRESLQNQVLSDADILARCSNSSPSSATSRNNTKQQRRRLGPLASRVFHHAMSQCHLSPSSSSQQAASTSPIYWNCDHAMALLPLPDLVLVGLDAEYLEEGAHYGRAGCHVVAPISNPSRNEWQCAVAVLNIDGGANTKTDITNNSQQEKILVEFDNDDEEDYQERDDTEENDNEDEDMEEAENDQDIYENYRVLGGTQNDTQLSQTTQLSAY